MLGLLSSQLAFSAASTLAKKTFEFSITSSLKGLSDVIRQRFSHSQVLQDTQAELEAKVKMLCLPVDLLAHYATRGNTALQEPLGVALGVLEEVEGFRQALVAHDVARAQDGASPDAATASAAQLCKRLRELISRLDSLLPYLSLAITTAVLLNQGNPAPVSYSRIMAASWHLRANPQAGAAVFSLPEASWHEERRLTAAGPRMGEVFRLCHLTIRRSGSGNDTTSTSSSSCRAGGPVAQSGARTSGAAAAEAEAAGQAPGRQLRQAFEYDLLVEQDLEDGLYHEAGEEAADLRLQVADIVALEWETTQSLAQGENEYRPALVLHVWQNSDGVAAGEGEAGGQPATPPAGSAARPSSRTSGRRGASAKQPAADGAGAAAAAGAGGGHGEEAPGGDMQTPRGAGGGSGGGGVGGSIRRCAIICGLHQGPGSSSDEEEEGEEGGEGGRQGVGEQHRGATTSSDGDSGGEGGCARRGGSRAAGAPLGGAAGGALASATLQHEWQILGELEFVLRLCILECREQAPHQDVTDERISMMFQATSVPGAVPAPAGGPSFCAQPNTATATAHARSAAHDSAAQHSGARRPSGSSRAAARWRGAAAGAAHALSAGVEAVTAGVRQLSFTPGGGGGAPSAAAPPTASASEAAASGSGRRTRSSSRGGGPGFGSPVQ